MFASLPTYPLNPSCKSVSTKLASLQPLLKAWSSISSSSAKIRLFELLIFEVSLCCPVCIFHSGQPSKRNNTREVIKPLWKGGDAHSWKSVLTCCSYQRNLACFNNQSASTCTPQVPRNWFHRENRKGPAFLGRPGLKGFMKPLHMKQTVASLQATGSKEYWSSHHQMLGIAPSAAGIPKPSTQNETEPALQLSPLKAGTTEFCLRALQTLHVTLGASWHFIDTLRSPQIF